VKPTASPTTGFGWTATIIRHRADALAEDDAPPAYSSAHQSRLLDYTITVNMTAAGASGDPQGRKRARPNRRRTMPGEKGSLLTVLEKKQRKIGRSHVVTRSRSRAVHRAHLGQDKEGCPSDSAIKNAINA